MPVPGSLPVCSVTRYAALGWPGRPAVSDYCGGRASNLTCTPRQERDAGADKGKNRDKDAVRKEVVRLRESIQKVTKSANPLGGWLRLIGLGCRRSDSDDSPIRYSALASRTSKISSRDPPRTYCQSRCLDAFAELVRSITIVIISSTMCLSIVPTISSILSRFRESYFSFHRTTAFSQCRLACISHFD